MGVESVYGTRKTSINYREDHMATYEESKCFDSDSGDVHTPMSLISAGAEHFFFFGEKANQ